VSEYMWTGGYQWNKNARLKGDANAVAAALGRIKDRDGKVDITSIREAWQAGDAALRETIGDEEEVMVIGVESMAYKVLHALEYEKVNVRTEEAEPGGRVFGALSKITGNPDNVRVFVEKPREAIYLGSSVRPPVAAPAPVAPVQAAPVEVLTMEDLTRPAPVQALPADRRPVPIAPMVPDRDMEAWVALCEWRERYGDIDRYAPIVAAMDMLD